MFFLMSLRFNELIKVFAKMSKAQSKYARIETQIDLCA
jgi:hypothetical protein